jgi:hypothetical protein
MAWPSSDLPLVPDPDEARRWAEHELAKPEYAAAEPTPFDRVAQAIGDFFSRLFSARAGGEWDGLMAVVVILAVVVLLAAAFLIWGRPRLVRRTGAAALDPFVRDERSATDLRREAAARAASADWSAAIVLRFRALARGLDERAVVEVAPGATVHAFARRAATAFPDHADALEDAADVFDDVRYLRRPGTAALYERMAAIDDAVAAARPVLLPLLAEAPR